MAASYQYFYPRDRPGHDSAGAEGLDDFKGFDAKKRWPHSVLPVLVLVLSLAVWALLKVTV